MCLSASRILEIKQKGSHEIGLTIWYALFVDIFCKIFPSMFLWVFCLLVQWANSSWASRSQFVIFPLPSSHNVKLNFCVGRLVSWNHKSTLSKQRWRVFKSKRERLDLLVWYCIRFLYVSFDMCILGCTE